MYLVRMELQEHFTDTVSKLCLIFKGPRIFFLNYENFGKNIYV